MFVLFGLVVVLVSPENAYSEPAVVFVLELDVVSKLWTEYKSLTLMLDMARLWRLRLPRPPRLDDVVELLLTDAKVSVRVIKSTGERA